MRSPDVDSWSPAAKLLGFAAASAVAAAAAFAVGTSLEPLAAEETPAHASGQQLDGHSSAAEGTAPEMASTTAAAGLAVTDQGYTLVPHDTTVSASAEVPFTFTVAGPDGEPVKDYLLSHEKELHLIVVRRDLSEFQHVHPKRAADGSWSVPLEFAEAGTYRVFADFEPAALEGDTITLGTDVFAAGAFTPTPMPDPARTAQVEDYQVTMEGQTHAGRESELTFHITRDGEPVSDLQPYLGAFGHLVSLRSGDLGYLHTHPAEEAHAGDQGGPEVTFGTTFPTPGRYRLYLDFSHGGQVRTAEFTVDVTGEGVSPSSTEEPASEEGGHGDDDEH
jgi:hypothetical protein